MTYLYTNIFLNGIIVFRRQKEGEKPKATAKTITKERTFSRREG